MSERGLARSLVEAYVHFDLVQPQGSAAAEIAHEPEGLVLRLGAAEVLVPYEAEEAAREQGLTFGAGLSELLDPGQWTLVAATYAGRALEGGLMYAAGAAAGEDAYERVATNWRFAADAVAEALKFFPEGAAELPAEAFWSEEGRTLRESEPARLTREKLERDLTFYRRSLTDFQRLRTR
ncbi:hypothetical protein AB0L44_12885 [Nonomuraea wenchangensis]|uniref:hypothetical protein n=1 Tax=Nonomuraea wenchangensis TaxID=568860 RepID=UPI003428E143